MANTRDQGTTPLTVPDHAHRWRIGEPAGPVSLGRCAQCGIEREFRNWLQELDFTTREERREAA